MKSWRCLGLGYASALALNVIELWLMGCMDRGNVTLDRCADPGTMRVWAGALIQGQCDFGREASVNLRKRGRVLRSRVGERGAGAGDPGTLWVERVLAGKGSLGRTGSQCC
jgi:hypothetical protein